MVGTLWHFELNFLGLHRGFVSLGPCSQWLARIPQELDINAIERFLDLWPRFLATIYVPFSGLVRYSLSFQLNSQLPKHLGQEEKQKSV